MTLRICYKRLCHVAFSSPIWALQIKLFPFLPCHRKVAFEWIKASISYLHLRASVSKVEYLSLQKGEKNTFFHFHDVAWKSICILRQSQAHIVYNSQKAFCYYLVIILLRAKLDCICETSWNQLWPHYQVVSNEMCTDVTTLSLAHTPCYRCFFSSLPIGWMEGNAGGRERKQN